MFDFIITLVSVVTGIVCLASFIAAVTPTPKDDVWIGKLYKLIDVLALNIGKAKEKSNQIMGFFEKLKISLNNKGRYVGDNPETEEDEAWVVDGDKNTQGNELMGFKLSIVLGIALVMLSGVFKLYYDKSEAEKMAIAMQLQTSMDNQLRLENAIDTQNKQIEKAIENKKISDARIESLAIANNEATEKIDELREKFASHDLDMLSLRKPGLIEKLVNRGTATVFKELEDLTNPSQFDAKTEG